MCGVPRVARNNARNPLCWVIYQLFSAVLWFLCVCCKPREGAVACVTRLVAAAAGHWCAV